MKRLWVISLIWGVALAIFSQAAQAQSLKPLSKAEQVVCQDLDMCVDLLLRHDPTEFDYDILAQEFRRLGPKARGRLIGLIGGRRKLGAIRAQEVLLQAGWQFTPAEQSEIAKLWLRGDVQKHAMIMQRIGSPMMRNRAIETLLHEDKTVREASRLILRGRASTSDFAMPGQAYGLLAKAAMAEPTPEIVTLLAKFPPAQSRPVLQRVLRTGDAPSVIRAYEAIYAINPEMAFESLLSTLQEVETSAQAFALSELLSVRHAGRKDGFYLKFASDLAADTDFPMLARMAGIDALMRAAPPHVQSVKAGAASLDAFEFTVQQDGIDLGSYLIAFQAKTGADAGKYASLIWDQIKAGYHPDKHRFVSVVADIKDPKMRAILQKALEDKADWRVTKAAALALGAQGDASSKGALEIMTKTHPILDVRAAAQTALVLIETGQGDYAQTRKALYRPQDYCAVQPHDFKGNARQLPYFDTGKIALSSGDFIPTPRSRLTTAEATKSGWLAGYDLGSKGGALIYYDNQSAAAETLSDANILAITPTRKVPLGQYANQFWIISTGADGTALIERLVLVQDDIKLLAHAVLPTKPLRIDLAPDQSLRMGFADDKINPSSASIPHPPLRLRADGAIMSACQTSSTIPSDQKALPQ